MRPLRAVGLPATVMCVLIYLITYDKIFQTNATLAYVSFGVFVATLVLMIISVSAWILGRGRKTEQAARVRLRQAEDNLAESLRDSDDASIEASDDAQNPISVPRQTVPGQGQREHSHTLDITKERLTLPALWEVTHSRLDLYHTIATGQARRSFWTAQVAIAIGFMLLIFFAFLAVRASNTAGAITVGTLGAVSGALAGYISRTFVRSQESAAAHLHAYFDQPLEFSRYLAAERLLASNTKLPPDRREILTILVEAIVASENPPRMGHSRSSPGSEFSRHMNP